MRSILDISGESDKGQPRVVKDVPARFASRPFYSADGARVGRHMYLAIEETSYSTCPTGARNNILDGMIYINDSGFGLKIGC